MKLFLAKTLYTLGDWYSKVPDVIFIYAIYNWLMCTSYKLDTNEQIWMRGEE